MPMPTRYTPVAIALHWVIALCIIAMIPMGLWMTSAISDPATQALAYRVFQIHKSIGFLILGLTALRIFWRLTHPVPPLPATMKPWEGLAARAAHVAFYGLMLALPLTGWLYVSAGWAVSTDRALVVPTSWFGLFGVPHLPWIGEASTALRRTVAFQAMGAHSMLAWGAVALIVLHIGAALKHQFIERDGVLAHMVPGLDHGHASGAPRPGARQKWLDRAAGLGLVATIIVAAAIAYSPAPPTAPIGATTSARVGQGGAPGAARENGAHQDLARSKDAGQQATQPLDKTAATATGWTIDYPASRIAFSGTHSGNDFTGGFGQWQGDIHFDPANLAGSRATVLVQVASARTGDATQEGAMEGEEWLDPKGHPVARFQADTFRAIAADRFEASGTLTLKTVSLPVVLPFTFNDTDGVATVSGALKLDRRAFDIGMQSDASGDWVSMDIGVNIAVKARRTAAR